MDNELIPLEDSVPTPESLFSFQDDYSYDSPICSRCDECFNELEFTMATREFICAGCWEEGLDYKEDDI